MGAETCTRVPHLSAPLTASCTDRGTSVPFVILNEARNERNEGSGVCTLLLPGPDPSLRRLLAAPLLRNLRWVRALMVGYPTVVCAPGGAASTSPKSAASRLIRASRRWRCCSSCL